MNIIESYLLEKGMEYKVINWQFNLKISPVSGEEKRNHFYINSENGLWDDKKTGQSGNFNQLREFFGDSHVVLPTQIKINDWPREYKTVPFEVVRQYQQRLRGLELELVKYLLEERCLEERTIKNFKLWSDNGEITIPIFDSQDNLINIRRRKNPKDISDSPKYRSTSWCKSILFNEVCLTKRPAEVIITEWEFDAMVLWQRGLINVVSVTLGAGYFSEERVGQFKDVKRVYIAFDNDEVGINWAKQLAEKLWKDRCRLIEIPKPAGVKKLDISDYFNKHWWSKEDFVGLMKKAKMPLAVDSNAVKHISEFNDDLRARLLAWDYKWISTGYDWLDSIIGWYRKGRVIILSWLTSTWKTSMSLNLTLSLAYRNVSTVYISMEMPPIDICKKFLMLHKKLKGVELENINESSPLISTIDKGLQEFKGDDVTPWFPIYLYNSSWEVSLKAILDICRVAKETYWAEVIVIDHLHYFAQDSHNRSSEVSEIMRAIKNMAMELDVPIILLAHLNRWWRQQQRRWLYIPTLVDLRDSWSIEQDADQVLFVCRDSEATDTLEKRKSVIKVAKNRDGKTGHISFDFNLDMWFFSEVDVDYLDETWSLKPMKEAPKYMPFKEVDIDVDDLPF